MILDSNILIGYLAGDNAIKEMLTVSKKQGKSIFISAVVEAEILSFNKFSPEERIIVEQFLESFIFIPVDRVISRVAADLRSKSSIKLPDALIAASALTLSIPLVTRNVRDFKNIFSLSLISV